MGSWFSSTTNDKKAVDSAGTVNNNLVLANDGINIYSFELALLMLIMTIIQFVKLFVVIYQMHKRNLRKTYENRAGNPA